MSKERQELNQLARETLLLNIELDDVQTKLDKTKARVKELWEEIDEKLDRST